MKALKTVIALWILAFAVVASRSEAPSAAPQVPEKGFCYHGCPDM